jgi:hypothetical protein
MENSYTEGIAVGVEKAVSVAILRRRQFYANGQFRGLRDPWSTPTAPTFDRRCRRWPSAYCAIPIVTRAGYLRSHWLMVNIGHIVMTLASERDC